MVRALRGAALPLSVLLAGCGGGGGGGGGVDSTPPPPPPPPAQNPPSNANTSLLNLGASETFTNDAATATARFVVNGNNQSVTRSSTAAKSTVTVVYDATNQTYRIDVGSRSQTFRPSDIVDNTVAQKTYQRVAGGTTDSLTLTKPGTSGVLTYQYVGGGFWQRTIEGAVQNNTQTIDGSFDAFAYGVETPDASLVRNGTAHYAVDLIGLAAPQTVYLAAVAGSGDLNVDFKSGLIQISGTATEVDATNGTGVVRSGVPFLANAQLSSSANLFTGTFHYGSEFELATMYNGTLDGRFYGPNGEEVGAAYSARSSDGSSTVGAIIGRKDNATPATISLNTLQSDMTFPGEAAGVGYNLNQTAPPSTSPMSTTTQVDSVLSPIQFTKADNSYKVSNVTFSPGSQTGSDSKFTSYRVVDGATTYDLKLYKVGSGNSELALNYTSLGAWRSTTVVDPVSSTVANKYFAYGLPTLSTNVPTTGSGHYTGVLYGSAAATVVGGRSYDLTGTAVLDWNFQSHGVTGTLTPVGVDVQNGTTRNFGALTFNHDNGGAAVTGWQTHLFQGNTDVGNVSARLFGPNAEEVGGGFAAVVPDGSTPGLFYNLGGAYVAKR